MNNIAIALIGGLLKAFEVEKLSIYSYHKLLLQRQ